MKNLIVDGRNIGKVLGHSKVSSSIGDLWVFARLDGGSSSILCRDILCWNPNGGPKCEDHEIQTYSAYRRKDDKYKYAIIYVDGWYRINRTALNGGLIDGRKVCKEGFDTPAEAYENLIRMKVTF